VGKSLYVARLQWVGGIAVLLNSIKILFDPIKLAPFKPDFVFVSHAHRDHAKIEILKKYDRVYMSEPTARILYGYRIPDYVQIVENGLDFKGVEFEFFDSGHVVGGKSVLIKDDERIFYTGDFCSSARIILKPLKYIEADILIIEATYGAMPYIFPNRKRLYKNLIKKVAYYVDTIGYAIVGARSLGTAQEVIALLSNTKRKFDLYVDPKVYKMSRIHFEYDYVKANFEKCPSFKPCIREGVYVTGVGNALKLRKEGYDAIICTGLSATWNDFNSLTLSSHEDLNGLINYVMQSRAERVYTVYGYKRDFAQMLKEMGLKAFRL